MSKYTGPTCKLARREKMDLSLKSGVTSLDKKCDMNRTPGQGIPRFARASNYSLQLRTKQKLKRIYGMREKQFKINYRISKNAKGDTSLNLIQRLETRFDNLLYRMGFSYTRAHARQMINHKAIALNGKACNIPSAIVKVGDIISIRERAQKQVYLLDAIVKAKSNVVLPWVNVNYDQFQGTLVEMPNRDKILPDINEQLVVELYSGKK